MGMVYKNNTKIAHPILFLVGVELSGLGQTAAFTGKFRMAVLRLRHGIIMDMGENSRETTAFTCFYHEM